MGCIWEVASIEAGRNEHSHVVADRRDQEGCFDVTTSDDFLPQTLRIDLDAAFFYLEPADASLAAIGS